jgi:hypothetical protein
MNNEGGKTIIIDDAKAFLEHLHPYSVLNETFGIRSLIKKLYICK